MEAEMNKFEYIKGVFGSDLKPRARFVLQCLIYHANKDGFCFPSIKTIAAECGYGLSTIKRALNDLCEAGYIEKTARFDERKNGGQTSNLYALAAVTIATEEDTENTDTEITANEDALIAENSIDVEYSYTFSDGLRRLVNQVIKSVSNEWTGGSSILYPLELNS